MLQNDVLSLSRAQRGVAKPLPLASAQDTSSLSSDRRDGFQTNRLLPNPNAMPGDM